MKMTISQEKFDKDLEVGEQAQIDFVEELKKYEEILSYKIAEWYYPDWDIEITTPQWIKTYEVKFDRKAEETGNFVIEYYFHGHPSWIYASKADYFAYNVGWVWWIQDRKELIERLKYTYKTTLQWGDDKTSMRLLRCDLLPDLFYKLWENDYD